MPFVEIQDLSKHFDRVKAVNGVDLAITEGELLVILGPSGCGKTTLMRMIAGLERPSTGNISIASSDVTELPPRARPIAMVFQSYALYPHMTVFNNIAFPLKAHGKSRKSSGLPPSWAFMDCCSASHASSQAANARGLHLPAPSSRNPRSSCWTNRSPTWMQN